MKLFTIIKKLFNIPTKSEPKTEPKTEEFTLPAFRFVARSGAYVIYQANADTKTAVKGRYYVLASDDVRAFGIEYSTPAFSSDDYNEASAFLWK